MKTSPEFADLIFANRCTSDSNIIHIADAASEAWRNINVVLSPVIGQHGVVALIKRSLHLQHANFPALKVIHSDRLLPGELPALHAVLLQQNAPNAVLMNNALLNTFYELLENLIGTALTRQLLYSVFVASSHSDPVQDILS